MEHKVTMTVELTVEAPEREIAEGAAYWAIQSYLDERAFGSFETHGSKMIEFDIEIN